LGFAFAHRFLRLPLSQIKNVIEFYYNFVDKYIVRSDFQVCEMDTDSLYFALLTQTLEEAVKPHLVKEFYSDYGHWFPSEVCDENRAEFIRSLGKIVPCHVCESTLCSKTYHSSGPPTKTSAKGLNKYHNKLNHGHYKEVLDTQ
jgi:hypothetical protein